MAKEEPKRSSNTPKPIVAEPAGNAPGVTQHQNSYNPGNDRKRRIV